MTYNQEPITKTPNILIGERVTMTDYKGEYKKIDPLIDYLIESVTDGVVSLMARITEAPLKDSEKLKARKAFTRTFNSWLDGFNLEVREKEQGKGERRDSNNG